MRPSRTAVLDTLGLTDDQRRAVETMLDAELHAAGARLAAVLAFEGHTLAADWPAGTVGRTVQDLSRARLVQVLEGWQTPDADGAVLALHERWRDR